MKKLNTKKNSMVDSGGYWNGYVNGLPGDDYRNIISLLDFPESLEGEDDSTNVENWEAQFQRLGPIPSEILQGFSNNFVSSDATSVVKQLPDVVDVSGDFSYAKESRLFQTPSPISVLDSNGSCPAKRRMSTSSELLIPVRTRTKRPRHSTVSKWHLICPITSQKTLTKDCKDKKKKKLSQVSGECKVKENSQSNSKRCTHCEVTKTPQWREGPMGPKTLCNACGVRYRSGRLFPEYRPAASPTFVPSLHSNSHRKVTQMRNKSIQNISMDKMDAAMSAPPEFLPFTSLQPGKLFIQKPFVPELDPAMSPPPEFVPMSSYLFDCI